MEQQLNELMENTKGAWKYHILEINSLEEGIKYTIAIYSKYAKHIKTVDLLA